jgi:hypothetical protein
MRCSSLLLRFIAPLVFAGCAASAAELFNGHDFAGWEFTTTPATDIKAVCKIMPDGVIAAAGRPIGFIATTASYENYRLHAEWRWSDKPGNGGVLVHISSGPKDRAWPLSLQIQTKHKNAGDLLPMAGATFAEPLTTEPGAKTPIKARTGSIDSEKPAGEWNSCDVLCQNGAVEVTVNGVLQNKITQSTPHSGRVGFQFEGTPFEIRHVTLTPLE